jgi:hypothetical protein
LTLIGNNFSEYELANRNSEKITHQFQENEEANRNAGQVVETNNRTINKISI